MQFRVNVASRKRDCSERSVLCNRVVLRERCVLRERSVLPERSVLRERNLSRECSVSRKKTLINSFFFFHFSPVPVENGRFLGDVSGMAEYVNGSVLFCRHSSCWKLNVIKNEWKKVNIGIYSRAR